MTSYHLLQQQHSAVAAAAAAAAAATTPDLRLPSIRSLNFAYTPPAGEPTSADVSPPQQQQQPQQQRYHQQQQEEYYHHHPSYYQDTTPHPQPIQQQQQQQQHHPLPTRSPTTTRYPYPIQPTPERTTYQQPPERTTYDARPSTYQQQQQQQQQQQHPQERLPSAYPPERPYDRAPYPHPQDRYGQPQQQQSHMGPPSQTYPNDTSPPGGAPGQPYYTQGRMPPPPHPHQPPPQPQPWYYGQGQTAAPGGGPAHANPGPQHASPTSTTAPPHHGHPHALSPLVAHPPPPPPPPMTLQNLAHPPPSLPHHNNKLHFPAYGQGKMPAPASGGTTSPPGEALSFSAAGAGQEEDDVLWKRIKENAQELITFAERYASLPHTRPPQSEQTEMANKAKAVAGLVQRLMKREEEREGGAKKRHWEEVEGALLDGPGEEAAGGAEGDSIAEKDMALIRHKRGNAALAHTASANDADPSPHHGGPAGGQAAGPCKAKYRKRSRATPPGKCHSCNIRETPEWRRGPDGARTLCNACGLHYAKLMRKRDKQLGPDGVANAPPIDLEMLRASTRVAFSNTARDARPSGAESSAKAASSHHPHHELNEIQLMPVHQAGRAPPPHHPPSSSSSSTSPGGGGGGGGATHAGMQVHQWTPPGPGAAGSRQQQQQPVGYNTAGSAYSMRSVGVGAAGRSPV